MICESQNEKKKNHPNKKLQPFLNLEKLKLNAVDKISGKPGFSRANSQYIIIFYGIINLAKNPSSLSRRKKDLNSNFSLIVRSRVWPNTRDPDPGGTRAAINIPKCRPRG